MVETHFLSRGNRFFFYVTFFQKVETVTEISGNPLYIYIYVLLFCFFLWGGENLLPLAEREFLYIENCFLLFRVFFLQVKTITETS